MLDLVAARADCATRTLWLLEDLLLNPRRNGLVESRREHRIAGLDVVVVLDELLDGDAAVDTSVWRWMGQERTRCVRMRDSSLRRGGWRGGFAYLEPLRSLRVVMAWMIMSM